MKLLYLPLLFVLFVASCASADDTPRFNPVIDPGSGPGGCSFEGDWIIPRTNVFDGGPGCDGIPAIGTPNFVAVTDADYLGDDNLVLVADNGNGEYKIYSHNVLDWHEIINDETDGKPLAIVYCPLTGTGIGWSRVFNNETTSFGVSGLLYNTNIIPYDRKTQSNWSQQRMQCVNGELAGRRPVTTNLLEMRWGDAKRLFPNAQVIGDNTGFNRNYQAYPYGDYRTNDNNIIFPLENDDTRLDRKERVLGIIDDERAKVYRFEDFAAQGWSMFTDEFGNQDLVIVGSRSPEAMVVFERRLNDGTLLEFNLNNTQGTDILTDQEGNTWNLLGRCTDGPRAGEQLDAPTAMMGYWFSWGAFYPEVEIY